jgi:GNAT superfamily N-acetyltransferase/pyrimidine operon attenuation protein/uracil phosphoribosyltransferase
MNYIYIEDTRVASLALDLVAKVRSMPPPGRDPVARIFVVGIGESGLKIAAAFMEAARTHAFISAPLYFRAIDKDDDRAPKVFHWKSPDDLDSKGSDIFDVEELKSMTNTMVLLIDGVVRTGKTLLSVYRAMLTKLTAGTEGASVCSYAIAVNPASCIIPTWFGTLYSPDKYVVLSRDDGTPNVSLLEVTRKARPEEAESIVSPTYPPVVLRIPDADDVEFEVSYPTSMNRYKSVDRFFDHQTRSRRVYVIEVFNKPIGYVAFHVVAFTLWLDYILIDDRARQDLNARGFSAAAALVRFVANYAQSVGCSKVGAWAIERRLKFYTDRGFQVVGGDPIRFTDKGQEEVYVQIARRLDIQSGKS